MGVPVDELKETDLFKHHHQQHVCQVNIDCINCQQSAKKRRPTFQRLGFLGIDLLQLYKKNRPGGGVSSTGPIYLNTNWLVQYLKLELEG